MKKILMILIFMVANVAQAKAFEHKPLEVVKSVNIQKYMGTWYEIERFNHKFEVGCGDVTANYKIIKNTEKVKVINTCVKKKDDDKLQTKQAKGIAFIVDKKSNARLKVSFVPFFKWLGWFTGDYNIIALGKNYEYALIGSEDRKYLWILSRTPSLSDEIKNTLKTKAHEQGFDTSKLLVVPRFKI